MGKIPFNVNAYTARLIGRENVSKLSGAILELVKNTYDADATTCIMHYDSAKKILYIIDNGCGMNEETIKKHWMTIGYSSKKDNLKSNKGRIQTGAKGIGRFALDRVGDNCEMLTVTDESKILWKVNWESFTEQKNITEISAEIEHTTIGFYEFLTEINNKDIMNLVRNKFKTGTIFKITNLRDDWNKDSIKKIKNILSSLIPYEYKSIFDIYFFVDELSITDAEVVKGENNFSYDYKIQFEATADNQVQIIINRDEFDFGSQIDEITTKIYKIIEDKNLDKNKDGDDKQYFLGKPIMKKKKLNELSTYSDVILNNIGKFNGVLYFRKTMLHERDKEKFYYKSNIDEIGFADNIKGIKLYRDNFRVRPYGEENSSSFDWLQLDSRRTKSPAAISHLNGKWRVSSSQMIGSIFISRFNTHLPDQANREGIVETSEFAAFREVLCGIISLFEEDRQKIGRALSVLYDEENKVSRIEEEIRLKADKHNKNRKEEYISADSSTHISASEAQKVIDKKDDIISSLEDENRLLRVLATTGIVTNTYIHEFKELTHRFKMQINLAKDALSCDSDIESALKYINKANEIKETFNSWFAVTIESVKKDKRKRRNVDIIELSNSLETSWKNILKQVNIDINFGEKKRKKIILKCYAYEIEAIFNNLISNSKFSLEEENIDKKEISIDIHENEEFVVIDYKDNGKGLSDYFKKNPYKILEPFETDKINELGEKIGTGMGMWIIDKTIKDYGGVIDLDKNITETRGFYITLKLKKRGDN